VIVVVVSSLADPVPSQRKGSGLVDVVSVQLPGIDFCGRNQVLVKFHRVKNVFVLECSLGKNIRHFPS